MAIGFLIMLIIWIIGVGISLLSTVFWIWMLADCAMNEPSQGNDKLVWLLLIIFLPFVGSVLYFFIRRPNRPVLADMVRK